MLCADANGDAFIYGGQALNSVELAKQDIRSVMNKRRLYTYSPDYWSLSFEPEDSVVQQRNMQLRSSPDISKLCVRVEPQPQTSAYCTVQYSTLRNENSTASALLSTLRIDNR